MSRNDTQVAVIGAGAAGLYTALCAARQGAAVTLVSATPLAGASSYWAQGGLAAALADTDSAELHLRDTINAGRGCVRESAARVLVDEAPRAVEDLIELGVSFDADRCGTLSLGLEGGHSQRRIVHAGGAATGRRIIRQLSAVAAEHPRIEVIEELAVIRILTDAHGHVAALRLVDGTIIDTPAAVVATGGAAAMWARTTNPAGAIGGGLVLAHDAGARLADLELMQFHPTAVAGDNGADGFLVTEAVRGEGAHLLDAQGQRFVDELAPRDEVARAVQQRIDAGGGRPVGLDMRHVDPALFPNVVGELKRAGIDPEHELIPVAPAAHYMMGGIATDLHGRASVPGLYAVGECSCTGLHGANRLASNSLSECFVFGARAARAAIGDAPSNGAPGPFTEEKPLPKPELTQASREALWRHAGLQRSADGLSSLLQDPHPLVRLIARAALARRESRGAHLRTDFPRLDPGMDRCHVTLAADDEPALQRWD
ncbi:MAG TPA: FAD-dependent oxidoreductase [Solirubrobacteraceae bacterium]|nr:FAD-dependent oxidoreductase [Solirubrobacteraceae bacterium]